MKAKMYPKMTDGRKTVGTSDLLVHFTHTVSNKMVCCVMSEAKGQNLRIARTHSGSMAALKSITEEHTM